MMSTKRKNIIIILLSSIAFTLGCVEEETKVTSGGSGKSAPDKMLASGAVTGLGPINLSGTTLTEMGAQALLNTSANRNATDLRLGMTTEIIGLIANSSGQGEASLVVAQSAVRGRVAAIDTRNRTITVLGVVVGIDQNTLFENTSGQLGVGDIVANNINTRGITLNDVVEVFAIDDPIANTSRNISSDRVLATRIIHAGNKLDNRVELVGTVGFGVSTNSPQIILGGNIVNVVGATRFTLVNADATIASIRSGTRVRVIGIVDPAVDQITATQFVTRIDSEKQDDQIIALDATVTAILSATRVRIANTNVELAATGIANTVTPGARLQLRGRLVGGVVQATNARLISPFEQIEYVLDGQLSALNANGNIFEVRGERINAANAVYTGGTAVNLANGKQVVVKGVAGQGVLVATSVAIK
jgi:cytochrome c-type biogenesis protein CcmE